MLKILATIAGITLATSASAATLTISSTDTFVERNGEFLGFNISYDIDPTVSSNRFTVARNTIRSTALAGDEDGFQAASRDVAVNVSYMGQTLTQMLGFTIDTYNNPTRPGAVGSTARFAFEVMPATFSFEGFDVMIDRILGTANCLGCAVGQSRTGNLSITASVAPVPVPAALGLLAVGLGAFGGLSRFRRKQTA